MVGEGRFRIEARTGQVDDLRAVGAAERPVGADIVVGAVVVEQGAHGLGLAGQHPVADACAQMRVPQLVERCVLADDPCGMGKGGRRGRRQVQAIGRFDVGGVAGDGAHRHVGQDADREDHRRRRWQQDRVQHRLALADQGGQLARRLGVDIAVDGGLLVGIALLPVIGTGIGGGGRRAVLRQGRRSGVFRMQGDVDLVGDDRVDQGVEPAVEDDLSGGDGIGHGLGGQVGAAHQERLDSRCAAAIGRQFELGSILGDDGVAVGLQILGVGFGDRRHSGACPVETVRLGEVGRGVEGADVEVELPVVAGAEHRRDGEGQGLDIGRHDEGQFGFTGGAGIGDRRAVKLARDVLDLVARLRAGGAILADGGHRRRGRIGKGVFGDGLGRQHGHEDAGLRRVDASDVPVLALAGDAQVQQAEMDHRQVGRSDQLEIALVGLVDQRRMNGVGIDGDRFVRRHDGGGDRLGDRARLDLEGLGGGRCRGGRHQHADQAAPCQVDFLLAPGKRGRGSSLCRGATASARTKVVV